MRLSWMNENEVLKYAIENGIIDVSYVQEKIEMNKRKGYLEKHKYEIWQGTDRKWYTMAIMSKGAF